MIKQLAKAIASNTDGPTLNPLLSRGKEGLLQVEVTGSATATLYGRLFPSAPWVAIDSFAASGMKWVALMPEMKLTVTSFVSGAVNAWLME